MSEIVKEAFNNAVISAKIVKKLSAKLSFTTNKS
jgi:hypothetical protein